MNLNYIVSGLKELGFELVTGVPDSLLSALISELERNSTNFKLHVAPNEGNAVALAAGHFLGTGKPSLVYMQNSGLPNALNPLTSLAHKNVYGIPMVIFIGWRGSFDEKEMQLKDEPQHLVQGMVTRNQLSDLGIPFQIASNNPEELLVQISRMHALSLEQQSPTAILIGPGIFDGGKEKRFIQTSGLSSENAIRETIELLTDTSILVGSTGMFSRELLKIENQSKNFRHKIFMNVGAMGHTSAIAKGVALAKETTTIVCFDGDGSLAMHFGTIAMLENLSNFKHVIINNGSHDSVGGQATSFGERDLSVVLREFSFGRYARVEEISSSSRETIKGLLNDRQSCLIEYLCSPRQSHTLPRPTKKLRDMALDLQSDF